MNKTFQFVLSKERDIQFEVTKYKIKMFPIILQKTRIKDKKGKSLFRVNLTKTVYHNQHLISDYEMIKTKDNKIIEFHVRDLMHSMIDKIIEEII